MAKISHGIRIKASKDKVFAALATTAGLKGWYTPDVEGEVAQGRSITMKFASSEPFSWEIAKLTHPAEVKWTCTAGPDKAAGTLVTFLVSETGDGRTEVLCDHEGFEATHKAYVTCNTLWGILMGRLKTFVETGKPEPAFA